MPCAAAEEPAVEQAEHPEQHAVRPAGARLRGRARQGDRARRARARPGVSGRGGRGGRGGRARTSTGSPASAAPGPARSSASW